MEKIIYLTSKNRLKNLERACSEIGVKLTLSERECPEGNQWIFLEGPSITDMFRANYLAGYYEGSDHYAEIFNKQIKTYENNNEPK